MRPSDPAVAQALRTTSTWPPFRDGRRCRHLKISPRVAPWIFFADFKAFTSVRVAARGNRRDQPNAGGGDGSQPSARRVRYCIWKTKEISIENNAITSRSSGMSRGIALSSSSAFAAIWDRKVCMRI